VTNYYKVLGIKRSASRAEVNRATQAGSFRHPDVNGGSEKSGAGIRALSKAYRVLIDPQERAYYRAVLHTVIVTLRSLASTIRMRGGRENLAVQARWPGGQSVLERDRQKIEKRQRAVFTTVSLFFRRFLSRCSSLILGNL